MLKTYSKFQPTYFDPRGLALAGQQDWLVHPCGTNRDADTLTRSNFLVACRGLEKIDPHGVDHELHRFGHWACGWFEIIIVRPGSACAADAEQAEVSLENYPILDEDHHSDLEHQEANEIWRNCYSVKDRIDYIRNASHHEFEFRSFADMLGCVRGHYFAGYASNLVSR